MITHASTELLVELVDGELDGLDAHWIGPHVRRCAACTSVVRQVVDTRVAFGAVMRNLDRAEPPEWAAALRTLETLGVGADAFA